MATVAALLGGTFGFLSALVALVAFNASWLVALGTWTLGGCLVALALIGLSLLPRRQGRNQLAAHHA